MGHCQAEALGDKRTLSQLSDKRLRQQQNVHELANSTSVAYIGLEQLWGTGKTQSRPEAYDAPIFAEPSRPPQRQMQDKNTSHTITQASPLRTALDSRAFTGQPVPEQKSASDMRIWFTRMQLSPYQWAPAHRMDVRSPVASTPFLRPNGMRTEPCIAH